MAGWIPRASSRSSARARSSSSARLVEEPGQHRVGPRGPVARLAQLEGERDETLLGTVVEIALDAPPLGVGRLDQPRPGRPDVVELGADLGLETLVDEAQARRRAGRLHQVGILVQGRVVQDEGQWFAVLVLDRRDGDSRRVGGDARGRPSRRRTRRPAGRRRAAATGHPARWT